jgi:hypothetical protein
MKLKLLNIPESELNFTGTKSIDEYVAIINDRCSRNGFFDTDGFNGSLISSEPVEYQLIVNDFISNTSVLPDLFKNKIVVTLEKTKDGTHFQIVPKTGIIIWILLCMLLIGLAIIIRDFQIVSFFGCIIFIFLLYKYHNYSLWWLIDDFKRVIK